jgi:transposase-like protein
VSQLCAALDEKVRKFREGPLGEIRYVWVNALYEKVRVDDRVESMAVLIATRSICRAAARCWALM